MMAKMFTNFNVVKKERKWLGLFRASEGQAHFHQDDTVGREKMKKLLGWLYVVFLEEGIFFLLQRKEVDCGGGVDGHQRRENVLATNAACRLSSFSLRQSLLSLFNIHKQRYRQRHKDTYNNLCVLYRTQLSIVYLTTCFVCCQIQDQQH